ncbi:hypothetical protein C8D77_11190 [Mesorhizobium loti]|uniref:Uncharacterized protein n=1 Tax=Rhizobium loti TaxID=381 RepID=A0A8E2W844_RHILI|nr:hypothetical protein [Mesorhizobium loti]PWJ88368.1 hypothetical protein C8D77_11190 [Mesorhizobium loti]
MADTQRTLAALQVLFADNTGGAITPQMLRDFLVSTPNLAEGSGAPGSAPAQNGQVYVDTTNHKIYMGKDTGAATDWVLISDNNVDSPPAGIDSVAGSTFSNGFVGLVPFLIPANMLISGVKFRATAAAASAVFEPVAYGSTGVGALSTRLANGSSITGAVQGVNTVPFTSGLAANAGDLIWIGLNLQTAGISFISASRLVAYFSQASIPAPSTPGSPTYASQGWGSMWPYGKRN